MFYNKIIDKKCISKYIFLIIEILTNLYMFMYKYLLIKKISIFLYFKKLIFYFIN